MRGGQGRGGSDASTFPLRSCAGSVSLNQLLNWADAYAGSMAAFSPPLAIGISNFPTTKYPKKLYLNPGWAGKSHPAQGLHRGPGAAAALAPTHPFLGGIRAPAFSFLALKVPEAMRSPSLSFIPGWAVPPGTHLSPPRIVSENPLIPLLRDGRVPGFRRDAVG